MSRVVIVTGMSGAGKTQAIHCLEDLGFFCVDNLPPTFIPKFVEMCSQSTPGINNIALVVDIRGGEFFDDLSEVLSLLEKQEVEYEILYLEASDEALVRRYKESRRKHPLGAGEVLRNIRKERELLDDLRERADKLIDTSNLTPRQLKEQVLNLFGERKDATSGVLVTVVSFGYKHGIPMDSDLVMDVRFLPNPHYVEDLRPLTGNDKKVRDYVMETSITAAFLHRFIDMLEFLIPHYIDEGKTTLMIALGCTGGKHRSVSVANYLAGILKEKNFRVTVTHRDVDRE